MADSMTPGEISKSVDFHAAHSPFGAFASFTCGLCSATNGTPGGTCGGFSIGARKPAAQNLYIGYRRGTGPWRLLPFFHPKADRSAEFTTEQVAHAKFDIPYQAVGQGEIKRTLAPATDRFEVGPFSFTLFSPFERIAELSTMDPLRQKLVVAPVVSALLEGDNSDSDEPLEIMFGFEDSDSGQRLLADTHPDLAGFAVGTKYGFAAAPGPGVRLNSGFNLFSTWRRDDRGIFLLGASAAVIFTVPPRQRAQLPLALGFFQDGVATTGLESHYFYTKHFERLEDVLAFGLAHHGEYLRIAAARDDELKSNALSAERNGSSPTAFIPT